MSFCASNGRSRIDVFLAAAEGAAVGEATPGVSAMAVEDLLAEFSVRGSKPMMASVRLQTSSCCCFVMGVADLRLVVLPGMAGMVEEREGKTGWLGAVGRLR
jgi:hypothetical protein